MTPDFDLIIIGGGLVGTCVAALAAAEPELKDLRIALLDAQLPSSPPADREIDLRVSAISRGSERILEAAGAWSGIAAQQRCAYSEMVVWDASGRPRGARSLQFSAAQTSEPNLGYIIENRRVLWALYDAPLFRNRVTVLRAELAGLDLLPDHARISLADGRTLTAGLAVGSDGSASLSRKLAGIETSGKDYEQRAFVTHVRTKHSHEHTAWQRFLPKGPIAFLPLVDGRSSIVWTTQPEHAEQLVQSPPEQVGEELEAAIGGVLGKVQVSGPRGQFPLRMSHAQHYCKDHFVLVGDAAHAVHPLAGQGVNLGFLDAAALVQTLAEARAAGSPPSGLAEHRVLRRYERWRKSENAIALGLIDGLNQLFGNANSTVAWARAAGLGAVNSVGVAKQFLIGRAMGIAGEVPRAARVGRE